MYDTAHPTLAPRWTWDRLGLASGIAAGALHIAFMALFVALVVPHMPPMDAPAAQAVAFYAEQSRSPIYLLISYLWQAQLLFLIPFFGGLYGALHSAEDGGGALSISVLAAGIATAIIPTLTEMIEHHLLLGLAAAGGNPVIVRGFDGMAPVSLALAGFPQAIVLGGTAALVLGRNLAPRWLGWAGLALAALSLVSTGTLVTPALVMLGLLLAILYKLWIVALGIALLRQLPGAQRQPTVVPPIAS